MKNAQTTAALVALVLVLLAAPFAFATEGVSPGAGDRLAVIRDNCPTFSWGEVDDAAFYEVVAYRLPKNQDFIGSAGVELSKENEVLYTRVAGAATAWTPSLERCFVSGGSYVWFVRAVFDEDETATAGEWSEGLFFSVAAAPSAEEVRQALGVLQRYLEEGGDGGEELAAIISGTGSGSGTLDRTRSTGTNKLAGEALPGTAAIRGEQVDPTGETYGVYGITNSSTDGSLAVVGEATAATGEVYGVGGITASADGAGVIAYNAADGPDLQLTSNSAGSAWLTEAGLDRNYPAPVTFNFENSSPTGSMALQIDGVEVVTTATDQNALGGLSCASGEVAEWNGSAWTCGTDADTLYDEGFGLNLNNGAFSVDPIEIQIRLAGTCPVGQSIRVVNQNGTVICEVDDDTAYSAGNQLDLAGTTFSVLEGSGSGLDADTLDTHNTDYFATSVHSHLGQTWTGSATHGLSVENTAASGFGLIGRSSGSSGRGVRGWASASTGQTSGVLGQSSSNEGRGVRGEASSSTGVTYGVYGVSDSTSGIGVKGEATAGSGVGKGVYGRTEAPEGYGVVGYAVSTTGVNYGVNGRTDSAAGFGGYFNNEDGGVDIMAGGSGDVAQTLAGYGLLKAAAFLACDESTVGNPLYNSFNNVPNADPIVVSAGSWPGACRIDFGFDMAGRFWTIGTRKTVLLGWPASVNCDPDVSSPTSLYCYCSYQDGSPAASRFMIMVF